MGINATMRAPFATVLFILSGCSQYPEDAYKGKEHWVQVQRMSERITYVYDMGSVRRAESKVIVNLRTIDDIDVELSRSNLERQARGLPLHTGSSSVLVIDCRKRTFQVIGLIAEFERDIRAPARDKKTTIVKPGSPIEEIHDELCL